MRVSEAWLREYVDPPVDTGRLVHQLTMAGLEVDSVESAAPRLDKVVVGRVEALEQHPQADRLRVCRVDVGGREALQIVCGAPNVSQGMHVAVALPGARLPGGIEIGESTLRGVASQGMLCSAQELGLDDSRAGLIALPDDARIGQALSEALHLDDTVLEVDLTPNRADCLSIEGIAREIAVLNALDFGPRSIQAPTVTIDDRFPIAVEDPAACPRYLGQVIRGIRRGVGSPFWLRERLRRCGLRSLGPVVDVTNYVLLELGQPLHAFDLSRLSGGIRVRQAVSAEQLKLLNDQTVELDAGTLVIADQNGPVALAGIMGGQGTAVSDETADLFIECAFFAPAAISGRARSYGLATDSSHRFERGVDPALQLRALARTTGLILELVGGEAGPVITCSSAAHVPQPPTIALRRSRLARILGVEVPDARVADILRRLDMIVAERTDGWDVTPPSFRFDLALEVDLVEEVGRVYGYDALPRRRPVMATAMQPSSERRLDADRIRDLLVDRGYQEAITYSFVEPGLQQRLAPDVRSLPLKNPLSSDLAVMRTSLWCGLLDAARKNLARQQTRVRLFEVGCRFRVDAAGMLHQPLCVAGLATGLAAEEQWCAPSGEVDFFDVKGDLQALFELSGRRGTVEFRAGENPALHPGQAAEILLSGEPIGWIGQLHPGIERDLEFERRVFLFEMLVEPLLERAVPVFRALSKFPQVRRDLALVVDQAISAASITACIEGIGSDLIRRVGIFDVYQGKGVDDGKKSVALGLVLQDDHDTLTDARVEQLLADVVARLGSELNAKLRA